MNLILIGLLSGILGGMGIGGGTVLIPALVFFASLNQQQAQGINLVVFIPTAIIAIIIHYRNKNLHLKIILPIVATGILGSLIGSLIATNVTPYILRKIFGVFMLIVGVYQFFHKKVHNKNGE